MPGAASPSYESSHDDVPVRCLLKSRKALRESLCPCNHLHDFRWPRNFQAVFDDNGIVETNTVGTIKDFVKEWPYLSVGFLQRAHRGDEQPIISELLTDLALSTSY